MPYAVVTGATSGLGLAYANVLARERKNLILVARSTDALEEVSKKLSSEFGVVVIPFVANLSDAEAVRKLAGLRALLDVAKHHGLAAREAADLAGRGGKGEGEGR